MVVRVPVLLSVPSTEFRHSPRPVVHNSLLLGGTPSLAAMTRCACKFIQAMRLLVPWLLRLVIYAPGWYARVLSC